MPAPMVAASATAILIDMICSHSPAPSGALKAFATSAGRALATHF